MLVIQREWRVLNDALMLLRDHSPSDFIHLDALQYDLPTNQFARHVQEALYDTEAEYELIRTELAEAGLM